MNRIEFQQRKEAAALANYTIGQNPRSILEQFAAKRGGKTTKERSRVLNTARVQAALACGRPLPTRGVNPNFEPRLR